MQGGLVHLQGLLEVPGERQGGSNGHQGEANSHNENTDLRRRPFDQEKLQLRDLPP